MMSPVAATGASLSCVDQLYQIVSQAICTTRVGRSAATDACERCLCESRIVLQLALALASFETVNLRS